MNPTKQKHILIFGVTQRITLLGIVPKYIKLLIFPEASFTTQEKPRPSGFLELVVRSETHLLYKRSRSMLAF